MLEHYIHAPLKVFITKRGGEYLVNLTVDSARLKGMSPLEQQSAGQIYPTIFATETSVAAARREMKNLVQRIEDLGGTVRTVKGVKPVVYKDPYARNNPERDDKWIWRVYVKRKAGSRLRDIDVVAASYGEAQSLAEKEMTPTEAVYDVERLEPVSSRKNPGKRFPRSTEVQSLMFNKRQFSLAQAKKWAREHDYKSGEVKETLNFWELIQKNSHDFDKDTFRIVPFRRGLEARIAMPKRGRENPIRSQAQRGYLHAAAARGEIPGSVVEEMERKTPRGKKLPYKVSRNPRDPGRRARRQMAGSTLHTYEVEAINRRENKKCEMEVDASSAQSAMQLALGELGDGWEIVEVELKD